MKFSARNHNRINRIREKSPLKNEGGFSLVETLIAVALIAIIGFVLAIGLNTSSKVLFLADELETAKNLAQSQMEYIKKLPYLASYSAAPITGEYAGFLVQIYADNIDTRDGIQKIRVVVSHENRPIILAGNSTLEGYKVRR
jgi:type II secretory pathway pseudopilin PulG